MDYTVLLHCDAGASVGHGHLMRTLSLAAEAERQGWKLHIAGSFDSSARQIIDDSKTSAAVHCLQPGHPLGRLQELAEATKSSLLHLDTYDTRFDRIREFASVPISNMQDGSFGRRRADIAIDANIGAEKSVEAHKTSDWSLFGASACQIRPQVRKARLQSAPSHSADEARVLVVIGGTDPTDTTPQIVETLAHVKAPFSLTVIAPLRQHEVLREAAKKFNGPVNLHGFTNQLPEMAVASDLVITAAGTSVWDFAYLGVAVALCFVTENQRLGYEASVRAGIACGLGDARKLDGDDFCSKIEDLISKRALRDRYASKGQKLIDGAGAWRVVQAWETVLTIEPTKVPPPTGSFRARAASKRDAQILFEWRNDPQARTYSRNTEKVLWEDHLRWFSRSLADPDRLLLLIEDEQYAPVGTVRWDHDVEDIYEASITIAPFCRGRGLASTVLQAGEDYLRGDKPKLARALIRDDNTSSRNLFIRNRYLPYLPSSGAKFGEYRKWLAPSM